MSIFNVILEILLNIGEMIEIYLNINLEYNLDCAFDNRKLLKFN